MQGAGGIGGLLARTDHSTLNLQPSIARACYHADGNGNITYLANSSQTAAASYQYDPYGNTITSSGVLSSVNKYRFSSKELMAGGVNGLYYYGYRWYAPNLQRWPNQDPLGEPGFEALRSPVSDSVLIGFLRSKAGANPYEFLMNEPTDKYDSFGLLPERKIDPDDPNPFGHWKKPHPFDPSCPDDREDLRDCFKRAQAYDNAVYKKSGEHLSSTEYMKVVEDCMKEKGHIYPPPHK